MKFNFTALIIGILFCTNLAAVGHTIHVSTEGNDTDPGTLANPVATLQQAQHLARKLRSTNTKEHAPITIAIRGGFYPLSDTANLRPPRFWHADQPPHRHGPRE